MTGNLNIGNNSIIGLKDPLPSNSNYAASVNFVNKSINEGTAIIDKKIAESEQGSIASINRENVFKKVMDDDLFKEDDYEIHKIGAINKDFHRINKKTYHFQIDYDSSIGYYSTRLSIDVVYLPIGEYTIVYEMYISDGLSVGEINASSGTLSVSKINSKIVNNKTRSVIHFYKAIINPSFDDLDIDIRLKGRTDPKTDIYVVVYGILGYQNDVPVSIWDRLYYYDDDNHIKFEAPIDMNSKKIENLAEGTSGGDAVNLAQMQKLFSVHFYTNLLEHNNAKIVKFPIVNGDFVVSESDKSLLRVPHSGYHQVIFSDFYKGSGGLKIRDMSRLKTLFYQGLNNVANWTPITFNSIFLISLRDGTKYSEIKCFIDEEDSAIFDGREYIKNITTLKYYYIKYLHP